MKKKETKKTYIKPMLETDEILETVTLNCNSDSPRTCSTVETS